MCLNCLQKQIQLNFSSQTFFSFAISDFAFPLASTSVVQLSNSNGEASCSLFMVSYLPVHTHHFLSTYIAEYTQNSEDSKPPGGHYHGIERFNHNKIAEDQSKAVDVESSSSCTRRGSLSLLIDGKASGRDSVNFLALLGVPSHEEIDFSGLLRHPNVAHVLSIMKSPGYASILAPKTPYTLENILHYSADAFKSEWKINFLIYQ